MYLYSAVIRVCGTVAALATLIYTMWLIFVALDPAGLTMPRRLGAILVSVAIINALVATTGWQVRAGLRLESAVMADRIAAAVTLAVVGAIEARMYKVAEKTAGTAHDELVRAIREVADGVTAELSDSLGGRVETWLGRAHTQGMIDENRPRPNGVASINARRET